MAEHRVAVVMNVTDPQRTRYLSYYAAVASWARQVDTVLVVDGHSREDLLAVPEQLFGALPNVQIVRTPETFWGADDAWHPLQSMHNLNFGLMHPSLRGCSAVFLVGADQIAYPGVRAGVDAALRSFGRPGGWARFHRSRLVNGRYVRRADTRGVLVFPDWSGEVPRPLHGWDDTLGYASDFPLHVVRHTAFLDPVNRSTKPIFGGPTLPPGGTAEVECASHGHFWYTPEQCLAKAKRWSRAFARLNGTLPALATELELLHGLYAIEGYQPRESVLAWDHPPEMRELVAHFYAPGMLGGAVRKVSRPRASAARAARRALALRGRLGANWLRRRGYRGLKDMHEWSALGGPVPPALDTARAFEEQDAVLSGFRDEWFVPPSLRAGIDDLLGR